MNITKLQSEIDLINFKVHVRITIMRHLFIYFLSLDLMGSVMLIYTFGNNLSILTAFAFTCSCLSKITLPSNNTFYHMTVMLFSEITHFIKII